MASKLLSPIVSVEEIDNTQGAAEAASDATYAAAVIEAEWGPINKPVLCQNENDMARVFGKPTDDSYKSWLTAAEFLGYAGNLWVNRASAKGFRTAVAKPETIANPDASYDVTQIRTCVKMEQVTDEDGNTTMVPMLDKRTGQPLYVRKAVTENYNAEELGELGDVVYSNLLLDGTQDVSSDILFDNRATSTMIDNDDTYTGIFADREPDEIFVEDNPYGLPVGGIGEFCARYAGAKGNSILVSYADSGSFANWKYRNQFARTPGTSRFCEMRNGANDELHLIVVDAGGLITGTKGYILEKYSFVSKASDAKDLDGDSIYYKDVINNQSDYIYWTGYPEKDVYDLSNVKNETARLADGSFGLKAFTTKFLSMKEPAMFRLGGGANDFNATVADFATAFDKFKDTDKYELNMIICGAARQELCRHVITEICEVRKDCVAFLSPSVLLNEVDPNKDHRLTIVEDDEQGLLSKNGGVTKMPITDEDGKFIVDEEGNIQYTEINQNYFIAISNCDYEPESDRIQPKYFGAEAKNPDDIDPMADITSRTLKAMRWVCEETLRFRKSMRKKGAEYGSQSNYIEVVSPASGMSNDMVGRYDYYNEDNEFSSSYAVLDTGWKYVYDKYNDVYRWIPLNGDVAGAYARTDVIADPWWSAAGYSRGHLQNVVKLSYSPDKEDRDRLYPNGLNPVINLVGEGTLLYGNKTLLNKPSAFQQVSVRRLFLYCERILSRAARRLLFELNDAMTRASAAAMCEIPLRQVQGSRGIQQFKVVCDETNNTIETINENKLVIDLYIQPTRSIDFVAMTFIAENGGSSVFTEQG